MKPYTLDDLKEWNDKIFQLVQSFGLKCYPQEFEVCDHNEMLGYMAYSGMPSRYAHWSYGKNFERQKTLYDHGVSGLPYEMVINSNPCLAYLMRDNSLCLQILTIAHVYGHNDFFANNFTFTSATKAEYAIPMFKNHAQRIEKYIEDPSIGIEEVEGFLDHAHALAFQVSKNLAIKKLSHTEQVKDIWDKAKFKDDPFRNIHKARNFTAPNLEKFPIQPEENILEFLANNARLPEWKRDLLTIVDKETRYFIPQMETKIMNEGWASYWHHKIMNALQLPQALHLEFLVAHNQVLRPHPGGLNPYHLGFVLWHEIEKKFNGELTASDSDPDKNNAGLEKIFEVRESDRDASFLRRFLTPELMRELDLFQHEKRGNERVITKVSDDENWAEIKNNLIRNVGTGSIPCIKIDDADFGKTRTLYLKHYHEGRDLLLEYAEPTLKHIKAIWGREVVLETTLGEKQSLIKLDNDQVKVEKL